MSSRPQGAASIFGLVSAILIGLTMIVASVAKMGSPTAFLETVTSYKLLPSHWSLLVATGLVGSELALGVLMVTGVLRRTAAWLNLVLLLVFSGVLIHAIQLGIKDCGCFGKLLEATPQVSLVKNAVLLVLDLAVLRWGRNLRLEPSALRHGVAWGSLCLGAAGFLAGSPAPKTQDPPPVTLEQLAILQKADPPVQIPHEGLLFLFGADCHHCWGYAGAVDLIARRLPALPVTAITYSGPEELDDFKASFSPPYPIHWLSETLFRTVAPTVPTAVWIRDGKVEQVWSGEVPSHRELAMLGGYDIAPPSAGAPSAAAAQQSPPQASSATGSAAQLFGGTVRARQN